jgi:hypothetical protein
LSALSLIKNSPPFMMRVFSAMSAILLKIFRW